jgi:hypothetical protein
VHSTAVGCIVDSLLFALTDLFGHEALRVMLTTSGGRGAAARSSDFPLGLFAYARWGSWAAHAEPAGR